MRVDTLSQMMNLGNVRPGGRYIVVDDASGIVVSAVLERLGGQSLTHHASRFSESSSQIMGD
jgi:Gcd10p family